MSRPAANTVTVCGRQLPQATHICAFFETEEQLYRCVAPFLEEGLRQGELVISIRDAEQIPTYRKELQQRMQLPLDEAERARQFRLFDAEDTYLRDGAFGSERMGVMLDEVLKEAANGPFKRVRTCGDMNWAARDMPGTDELMEYESLVNLFTREHDCTLMCVYDLNRFSGRAVMELLATHPMVVMGDRLYENTYYVEPTQYLGALLRRGSSPLGRASPA